MSDYKKTVLDACCGSRMFWFNKSDERAVFNDIRKESHILLLIREGMFLNSYITPFVNSV